MTTSKHHYLPFHFHKHHWDMEILEYYIFKMFYNISHSTMNLFIPIFLLNLGYSLWQVMAYYVINQFWFMFAMPFAGRIVQKMGIKHAMALHLPFIAIFFFGLRYLSGDFFNDIPLLLLILGLRGFFKTAYNVADNVFVTQHLFKKKQSGRNLAFVKIVLVLAGVIAPLMGGLVAFFWGFNTVFTVGIILTLISGIPLLLTPDEHFELGYNPKHIYQLSAQKINRHFLTAEFGRVMADTILWIMWPLFIYFIVKNTANMGILVSLSAFISMIIAYYVGKYLDRKKSDKIFKKAVHGATSLFFLRAFSLHPLLIGVVDVANNVLNPVLQIPYDYYVYGMLKHHPNRMEISNVKQLVTEGLYTLGVFLLMILAFFFPEPSTPLFMATFAVSAFFLLLMKVITRMKLETQKISSS